MRLIVLQVMTFNQPTPKYTFDNIFSNIVKGIDTKNILSMQGRIQWGMFPKSDPHRPFN